MSSSWAAAATAISSISIARAVCSAPRGKIEIEKKVREGKLGAELAYLQRNGFAWADYDADCKKGYDLVLVALDPSSGKVGAGYSIGADGKATHNAWLTGGALVRP